jgi:pyruvate/2-oxoacid:ferredoxin oxidoreductase alpha subunit
MVDVTRETPSMRGVGGSRQDIMSIRDSGWIQIEPENCQEVLDSVIMAYRLAEDPDVLFPVVVAYDGFFLSHQYERVDVPEQELVDKFLAPVSKIQRTILEEGKNLQYSVSIAGKDFAKYRYKTLNDFEKVKEKFKQVEKEFYEIFGREYGGMVEQYKADDADILFLTAGSCGSTIKTVDRVREKGLKVGLARIRMFRPYPREELGEIINNKKAVCVIDRSICLGWNCGHLYMEAKAVLSDISNPPKMIDFIDGLSNLDITIEHIEKALALTLAALEGKEVPETNWLIWE